MIAIYERRIISQPEKIWAARYLNLQNIVHWHDECEIVFCEKKTCEIECNEEKIILSENETAFIRSRAIHKIKAEKGGILITLLIDSSLLKDIIDHYQLKNIKVNMPTDISALYSKIKKELAVKQPFYDIILKNTVCTLVAEIFRNNPTQPFTTATENRNTLFIQNVLNDIETNYRFITFKDTYKKFGYSPAHFSRLFSTLCGMNFTDYLNTLKIEHAVYEIQNLPQKSITQIGIDNGFTSIRNFNRIFKKITGFTPRELPNNYSVYMLYARLYNQAVDPTQNSSILLDI